jgi:hypothetical protein
MAERVADNSSSSGTASEAPQVDSESILEGIKNRDEVDLETGFRVCTASPPMGCGDRRHWRRGCCSVESSAGLRHWRHWLNLSPARMVPFLPGPNRARPNSSSGSNGRGRLESVRWSFSTNTSGSWRSCCLYHMGLHTGRRTDRTSLHVPRRLQASHPHGCLSSWNSSRIRIRRLGAKPDKIIVDVYAASPSS